MQTELMSSRSLQNAMFCCPKLRGAKQRLQTEVVLSKLVRKLLLPDGEFSLSGSHILLQFRLLHGISGEVNLHSVNAHSLHLGANRNIRNACFPERNGEMCAVTCSLKQETRHQFHGSLSSSTANRFAHGGNQPHSLTKPHKARPPSVSGGFQQHPCKERFYRILLIKIDSRVT